MDEWLKINHDKLVNLGFVVTDNKYTIKIKGHYFVLEWVEPSMRKSAYGELYYGGYSLRGDVDHGVHDKIFTEAPIQNFEDIVKTVFYLNNVTLDVDMIGDRPRSLIMYLR